jgi:hypothetical protein
MESVDFTTEDLLNELREYHQPVADRRPGGVTRQEYADGNNCSIKYAKKVLDELVADGVLVEEFNRLGPGSRGYVYYKNTA